MKHNVYQEQMIASGGALTATDEDEKPDELQDGELLAEGDQANGPDHASADGVKHHTVARRHLFSNGDAEEVKKGDRKHHADHG